MFALGFGQATNKQGEVHEQNRRQLENRIRR
jgi:hypothetical protein